MTNAGKQQVGVIGLGSMGMGMARSLHSAGLTTYGHDTDPARVAAFQQFKGQQLTGAAERLPDHLAHLDIVVLVVVNAAQVEAVLFGPHGIAQRLEPGTVVICAVTVAPEMARKFAARLDAHNVLYLDAPISGGAAKAAEGALTIMASGPKAAFDAAAPALDAMAATVFHLGDVAGPGSAMKSVNQLLAGIHIAAAAEAITYGMSQGIEPADCVDVISKCAGSSWMFENRGPHIVDGDYAPRSAVEIFVKDLGIVADICRDSRFPAPLGTAALQQFIAAAGMGHGQEDDAAVAKVYAALAGLSLPKKS